MTRSGQGSHFGGRNYRLNWIECHSGLFKFGDYTIEFGSYGSTTLPWLVYYKGGYHRFASADTAKRWVEKRIATRRCT